MTIVTGEELRFSHFKIEFRVHFGEQDELDSLDIEYYNGKNWREVHQIASECAAGRADQYDDDRDYRIVWIERCSRATDQFGGYMGWDEYSTLWECPDMEVIE
tara:strand:- start:3002 stop:3310 length:309 start_codon:yes stop_codon:yes gene_type:complete